MDNLSICNRVQRNSNDGQVWGIDIGGANIKLCRSDGASVSAVFPMWTDHERIGSVVLELLNKLHDDNEKLNCSVNTSWSQKSMMAVTMTGELADCFFTRREGVEKILDGLTCAIPSEQCRVYAVGGQWLSVAGAKQSAWDVAASNWHALANWLLNCNEFKFDQFQAIIDIGSTTIDIIPIVAGKIGTSAKTDRERMQLGQLIYTGLERTPIHAVLSHFEVEGAPCPVMAERFATVLDAHLILRTVAEEPNNCDTADGRPRTRQTALARLARMIGEDSESLAESVIVDLAEQVLLCQVSQIAAALTRNLPTRTGVDQQTSVAEELTRIVVSGHGRPLIERLRIRPEFGSVQFVMLDDIVGPIASRCAPALAVAQLWEGWERRNSSGFVERTLPRKEP
jgi:(4-(4-[2-(gamma-L-glutamylamino)ethyl]phenoxymethyl)furan-2-yl)methanamine synthase